jgi:hypothetical protein
MKKHEFFERNLLEVIFPVIVQHSFQGMKPGNVLSVLRTKTPAPPSVVILVNGNCRLWPMRFKATEQELATVAMILVRAILLSRDLTKEDRI